MKKRKIKYLAVSTILTLTVILSSGCALITEAERSAEPAPVAPALDTITSSAANGNAPVKPESTPSQSSQPTPLPSIADVIAKVKPSVVAITTEVITRDFFNRLYTQEGAGSGWIISQDGFIVTNNHVVENAKSITVTLEDGRTVPAEVVGTDPLTDLAVIKIDAEGLPAVTVGDSDKMRVGDWVVAIGNSLGQGIRATQGIVSRQGVSLPVASKQVLYGLIETDAAINPGNSGGALVDLEGNLMGINTAIYSRTGGYQGIGFAVPANMAREIMIRLIEDGKITRGFLGVEISDLDADLAASMGLDDNKGVLIANVIQGGPAVDSDIQKDDVVLALNGIEVENSDALRNRIADFPPGTEIELDIYRDGRRKMVEIELGELPDNPSQLASSEEPEKSPASNIGIDVMNISREWTRYYEMGSGVVIAKVVAGSVAEDKGLQRGELITEVNGEPVSNVREFVSIIRQFDAGEAIRFRVQRGEQQRLVGIRIPVE